MSSSCMATSRVETRFIAPATILRKMSQVTWMPEVVEEAGGGRLEEDVVQSHPTPSVRIITDKKQRSNLILMKILSSRLHL